MKAMILCAGRGERMKPLTDHTPKPLLLVKEKPLVVWHIEKLVSLGFSNIVINIAHLGYKISELLGNGSKWGINIIYSNEQESGALESAGGIIKALPFFTNKTFLVVNGDIFCDYKFNPDFNLGNNLAHLILVKNPKHNPNGDFALRDGVIYNDEKDNLTFSGIGYYSSEFFKDLEIKKRPLAPLLKKNIENKKVSGSLHLGIWHDIGTPKRLEDINKEQ